MVNTPILLKENNHQFLTTREEYMNDNNRKHGGSGKFSFRTYKTDKERVEEYLRDKEELEKRLSRTKKINKEEKIYESNLKNNRSHYSVKQPIMRFKPRTDIERIYYAINDYSYGRISKDAVNEQLSKLHLNEVINNEDETSQNKFISKGDALDEKMIDELEYQKEFLMKQGYDEKNSETVKQITQILDKHISKNIISENDPSRFKTKQEWRNQINTKAAKKLMEEYNKKTHFKAASVYSFNLEDIKCKKNMKRNPNKTITNFLNFNSMDEPSQDEMEGNSNFNMNNSVNEFSGLNNLLKKSLKNNISGEINPMISNIDFNPLLKKSEDIFDYKKLNYLKKLSQGIYQKENVVEEKNQTKVLKNFGFLSGLKKGTMNILSLKNTTNNNFFNQISVNDIEEMKKCKIFIFNILDDEEKITIDNETYLKSQLDLISKKILKKCNFINSKSEFNNKNLKAGNGKLMITSGLTVNEFSKKYNMPK